VSINVGKEIIEVGDLSFIKYINARTIEEKVQEIADSIREDFHEKYPMFLVVMNGAFIYAADLIRKLDFPCELNFVRIKSYHGTESTGKIDIYMPPNLELKDRHIIIVEDMIILCVGVIWLNAVVATGKTQWLCLNRNWKPWDQHLSA